MGRSFSDARQDAGTSEDPSDDYWPASFVDPGTGAVYHSQIAVGGRVWYNGQYVEFDIMVSVSPTDEGPNDDTAQYWVPVNDLFASQFSPELVLQSDLVFTLLGDPDPASSFHRVMPLMPGGDGLGAGGKSHGNRTGRGHGGLQLGEPP